MTLLLLARFLLLSLVFFDKGTPSPCFSSGDKFVIAFPANINQRVNSPTLSGILPNGNDRKIFIGIKTDPATSNKTEVNGIRPNEILEIYFNKRFRAKYFEKGGVSLQPKAITLYSDDEFSVFGINMDKFTGDGYLGLPTKSLGNNYFAACHWPSTSTCQFLVAAVSANTLVRITLPKVQSVKQSMYEAFEVVQPPASECRVTIREKLYKNGDSFKVFIKPFEIFQIQNSCDLTGTLIESVEPESPIAVWSGNVRANVGTAKSRDHLIEMLFPTTYWGNHHIAWPTPNAKHGDFWVLTSLQDDNTVEIAALDVHDAKTSVYLNRGESYRLQTDGVGEWMTFKGKHPIQVFKFSRSADTDPYDIVKNPRGGDAAMTTAIPIEGFASDYLFRTIKPSSHARHYVTIIANEKDTPNFFINGSPVTDIEWNDIPGSPELKGGFIELAANVVANYELKNKASDARFTAYYYAAADREGFGFPLGVCFENSKVEQKSQNSC